jgi:type IV pilus assembly protein PilX
MTGRFVSGPASQRGYMLMLVLVALVAMMISGVALVRSMDTNQLVAGNMASRNSTIHSADLAVQQAVTWIQANATNGVLFTDVPASGYHAEAPQPEPDWQAPGTWSQCATTSGATPCFNANDGAGNQVSWVIHRMCSIAGGPGTANQFCSSLNGNASSSGNSYSSDAVIFNGLPKNFYRISIQVTGPRNTTTLTQAFVTL